MGKQGKFSLVNILTRYIKALKKVSKGKKSTKRKSTFVIAFMLL